MKPAPFAYRRPGSLAEALSALAGETNAKVLAGGQSLVPAAVDAAGRPGRPRRHQRAAGPGRRRGLRRRRPGGCARPARRRAGLAGGAPRPAAAGDGAAPRRPRDDPQPRHHGRLDRARRRGRRDAGRAQAARRLASRPSRSRGRRTIAADDLFLGPLESSLRPDEIAVSAFFPALAPGAGVAFDEIARRHGDYALCGVAALVRVDGDRVVEARAGYLSVNELPTVVDLTGRRSPGASTDASLAAAGEAALAGARPRRGHPRHRGVPRPAGAGADRPRPAGGVRRRHARPARRLDDRRKRMSEELHSVRLVRERGRPTTSACPRAGCCPTRCVTTSA